MDPFSSKLAFSAAAAGAALLGAIYPVPRYEAPEMSRPWAKAGAVNAWQPASGMEDRYSYAGALPNSSGPIDVYGQHPWILARVRQEQAREEAQMRALLAEPVAYRAEDEVLDAPLPEAAPAKPQAAVVTVTRGSKEAEEVPLEPAPQLAVVSEQ
ncbi:hypothetical protein OKA06_08500 [Novosphingobium sp. MW5]|nr:hypothetical protein [Novosphingobium sp. MW5]